MEMIVMKCRICGSDIDEKNHDAHQCSCCSNKCSKGKCCNCGHQNLSETNEFNFKQLNEIKRLIKKLKISIIK